MYSCITDRTSRIHILGEPPEKNCQIEHRAVVETEGVGEQDNEREYWTYQ